MQRMTKRLPNGVIHANFIAKQKESVMGRLAAYEDTGLEPKEIIELKARMEGLEK